MEITSKGGYVLCASPRSGSTLLCDLLKRSGVAGAPDSFFRTESVADFALTWGVEIPRDGWDHRYVDAVRGHGARASGRFGMRIMWSDMPPTLARLATLYPRVGRREAELLREVLGVEHFIHLSRTDRLAEAISLLIAEQTGLWHRNADGTERERPSEPSAPRYDHDAIATRIRILDGEADGWRRWFADNDIQPLKLTYEDLADDATAALAKVVTYLGGEPPQALPTGTARLATSINDDWSRRFQRERAGER